MYKKYGDIYEVDMGQRMIVLCRADLIDNLHVPSVKTKYPYRWKMTEGFLEYGLDKSAIFFLVVTLKLGNLIVQFLLEP